MFNHQSSIINHQSSIINHQSSSQVNDAPFLFFGYAQAIRSQGITGFGAKEIGISLAEIISEETSALLLRSKMNDFHNQPAQEGELNVDFVDSGHIRCCR
jgi:hypothetical protein